MNLSWSEIPFLHSLCCFFSLTSFHCTVEALDFFWGCKLASAFTLNRFYCLCKRDKVVWKKEFVRVLQFVLGGSQNAFSLPSHSQHCSFRSLVFNTWHVPLGKKVQFLSVWHFFLLFELLSLCFSWETLFLNAL